MKNETLWKKLEYERKLNDNLKDEVHNLMVRNNQLVEESAKMASKILEMEMKWL